MLLKVLKSECSPLKVSELDYSGFDILELSSDIFEAADLTHGEQVECFIFHTEKRFILTVVKSKNKGLYCKAPDHLFSLVDDHFSFKSFRYVTDMVEHHYPTLINVSKNEIKIKSLLD
jgi:aspartate 1-decarboxylase